MKKMTRNFVSISFALALCGGISSMVFAQDADAPVWGTPSPITIGTGTFSIGVQTVYDGFYVTTPVKKYNPDTKEWESQDTTINEDDGGDTDYLAQISISATYDNSNAPGVGYSFGVGAGLRRVDNNAGTVLAYFDNPWGKAFFFEKQLWIRAGGLEAAWNAWNNNWGYAGFDGGVQLNINPSVLQGLNIGVSLPVHMKEEKADYPFKNMVAGFKLGGLIPNTTISSTLRLKETPASGLKDSMDLNAELRFSLKPIELYFEMQYADLNQTEDDLKAVELNGWEGLGDDTDKRSVNLNFHPYLEFSLASLVDLGTFSLGTVGVGAWIRSDPLYVSDNNSNTTLSLEWTPTCKLTSALTASLFFGGYFNAWGGDPTKTEEELKTSYKKDKDTTIWYTYNQFGFTIRPGLALAIAPNAEIRLRDAVYLAQTGVDPKAGIKNQIQVRFYWGF